MAQLGVRVGDVELRVLVSSMSIDHLERNLTVVKDPSVESGPIVPNCDRVFRPFPSHLELVSFGHGAVEGVQYTISDSLLQSHDLFGKIFVHVESLPTCHRMSTDGGVLWSIN